VHVIKAYRGSRGVAPFILNLTTRRRLVGTSRFTPGSDPRYGLSRRLGVTQSLSGQFEGQKNPLSLPGFEPRTVLPTLQRVIHTNAESVTLHSQQAPKKQSDVTIKHYPRLRRITTALFSVSRSHGRRFRVIDGRNKSA
jgi:hypothetical protein